MVNSIIRLFKHASKNAFRRKSIAILAIAGIGIGIMLQVTLNSFSNGMSDSFDDFLGDLAGNISVQEEGRPEFQSRVPNNITDVLQSNDSLNDHIEVVSLLQYLPDSVSNYGDLLGTTIMGSPNTLDVIGVADLESYQKVSSNLDSFQTDNSRLFDVGIEECVISYELYNLDPIQFDLNEKINIWINTSYSVNLTIVGILSSSEVAGGLGLISSADYTVYTSIQVTQSIMEEILTPTNSILHFELRGLSSTALNPDQYSTMTLRTDYTDNDDISAFIQDLSTFLTAQYEIEFTVISQSAMVESVGDMQTTMTTFITIIALITLIAGSMGIVIAQLVGVEGRMKEFAILKATGWKNGHILSEVVFESVILGVVGSLAGILASFVLINAMGNMQFGGGGLQPIISTSAVIQAILIALFIGIVGGAYPGIKASSVRPMEILHGK